MKIIMFSGKARVGKTHAAKQIAELAFSAGMKPVLLPFAKPIKDKAKADGFTKEENPQEYRTYCQLMGEGARKLDPDYWINKWIGELQAIEDKEHADIASGKKHWEYVVIVDDCRYANEIKLCSELGGLLVFVRHGKRKIEDLDADWRNHESEDFANEVEYVSCDDVDYYVENDATLRSFNGEVHKLSRKLLGIVPPESQDNAAQRISALLDKLIEKLEDGIDEEAEDSDY